MHWHKCKYLVTLKGGKGFLTTEKLRGLADHIIITPKSVDTEYDVLMIDRDGDCIYECRNHVGRLDDKDGLPIGKDQQESLTVLFENASKNEKMTVIFKVRDEG